MRWIKSRRGRALSWGHRAWLPPSLSHCDLEGTWVLCPTVSAPPSRAMVLTEHTEHISMPPPLLPTSFHSFWQPFHLSSRNNFNHLQDLPKTVLGLLLLILLVAFGSCIEEKGEYQHFIAIYGQQQSEGRETEAGRGDGGSGKRSSRFLEAVGGRIQNWEHEGTAGGLGHSGARWQHLQSWERHPTFTGPQS